VDMFRILLFLHVIAAIAAFGPGFASMVVGPMVAKEPQYGNFYARTQVTTARSLVTPLALSMALTGIGMILVRGWTNIVGSTSWLMVAIVLYVIAIAYAFAVQAPAGQRLVELTSTPPAPGSAPNPEIPATAKRLRNGGILLTLLVTAIVFLMVVKPF
jgi:Predicted integral membrane protein (DUF2269)